MYLAGISTNGEMKPWRRSSVSGISVNVLKNFSNFSLVTYWITSLSSSEWGRVEEEEEEDDVGVAGDPGTFCNKVEVGGLRAEELRESLVPEAAMIGGGAGGGRREEGEDEEEGEGGREEGRRGGGEKGGRRRRKGFEPMGQSHLQPHTGMHT